MRQLLVAVSFVLIAGTASAQSLTGNFAPFNSWWVHPSFGSLGVNHDGTFVNVDRDGDGTADVAFSNTQVAAEARTNLRLSPTREFMVGWGGSCGIDGVNFYVWSIPPAPGTTLTAVVNGTCINRSNGAPLPRFYDTGLCQDLLPGLVCTNLGVSPKRVLYILTGSAVFDEFELVWIDLATGTVTTTNNTGFRSNAGFIHVSPSGTQAFVQHDLGIPGETDYTLIDLCPGSLGTALNAGGFPIANSNEVLRAETTTVSGGDVTVVAFDGGDNPEATFTLTDCCAPTMPVGACCHAQTMSCDPSVEEVACNGANDSWLQGADCGECVFAPATEACCFMDGSCLDLEPASCGPIQGTPMGPSSMCSTTACPFIDLVVDMMGDASVTEGDLITYVISYRNDGTLMSTGAVLTAFVPFDTTFVSVSGNGDHQFGNLTWALGELAPGASGVESFTVRAGCGVGQIQLSRFSINLTDASFNPFTRPASDVVTMIDPLASGPINVALSSVPAAGPPVPVGDLITHTISLENTIAQSQVSLQLSDAATPSIGFHVGTGVGFEAVVDDGGGTFSVSNDEVSWAGDLPAGTTDLVFTTRVDACLEPGTTGNQLNFGNDVAIQNACAMVLGTAMVGPTLDLEVPVLATLSVPSLNPAAQITSPVADYSAQLARPGETVAVQLRLASGTGQPLSGVQIFIDVQQFGFGGGSLVSPSDPGAVYEAGLQRVMWSGTIPASGDLVVATFEGTLPPLCRMTIEAAGGSSAGCNDIERELVIASVPEPPANDYIVALGIGDGASGFPESVVLSFDPATSTAYETELCLPSEFLTGIGVGPGGDVWVGWLPTFRYNARTLEIEGFDSRLLSDVGLTSLSDITLHPTSGIVYFIGGGTGMMGASYGSVVSYDPASGVATERVQDFDHRDYERAVVDDDGNLVVVSFAGDLLRIDRATWSVEELDTGEGTLNVSDVDIDVDGDYVAYLGSFSGPFLLKQIDATGIDPPRVVDPNLATSFPSAALGFQALTVDRDTDSVFVAPLFSGLGRVDRDASGSSVASSEAVPITQAEIRGIVEDLHFTSIPEPRMALLALSALVAVAVLRARDRRARAPGTSGLRRPGRYARVGEIQ